MPKKIRKHTRSKTSSPELLKIVQKNIKTRIGFLEKHEQTFPLSEVDRLTKIIKKDKQGEIREITCVSLEIQINMKWVTIVYYDNFHDGLLHKHQTVSLENPLDTPTANEVEQNGTQKELLTWAMRDITKNFFSYKTDFFRRSKIPFEKAIDMQYK